MAIKIFRLDPNAISKNEFNTHTHNYRKVTRIGIDEAKAWTSPTFEDVIDDGDTVAVGNTDIEGAALTTATAKTNKIEKWSGLGMVTFSASDNIWGLSSFFSDQIDDLLANGFTDIRTDCIAIIDTGVTAISKEAVAIAVAKGANVIWGVNGHPELTAANWAAHRQRILDAATWAQANGVYEFIIGNEDEMIVDGTTLTVAQLIVNLKSVATDVQAIFTNGDITYSCWAAKISDWISAGKGDIDNLASNIYMGGEGNYGTAWKGLIDNLVSAFGVSGTYLTEFGPSWDSLDDYSTDEAVQAAGTTEMLDYIKASGITKALYYCYYDDPRPWSPVGSGVLKTDKTYRLLWYSLLNSG